MSFSINQLTRASQGKTHRMGGLNVWEIRKYLKVHTGTRADLQQTLNAKLATDHREQTVVCGAFSLEDCGHCLGVRRQTACGWLCATSGQPCRRETIGPGLDRCFQHVMQDLRVWSSRDLVVLINLLDQGVDLPMTRLARLGYIKRLSHHVQQRSAVPLYQSDLMTTITGFLADEDGRVNLAMHERLQASHPQAADTFRHTVHALRVKPDATDAVIQHLAATFPNVTRLRSHHNRFLTDTGVQALSGLTQLHTLRLTWCAHRITTTGIQALSRLTNLRELDLTMATNLTLEDLRSLCTLTNLQTLNLRHCGETLPSGTADRGAHLLSTMLTQLQEVWLDQWTQLTDAGVHSLTRLTRLVTLSLSECTLLTDAAVPSLCGMTRLESLFLAGSPWLTDSGVNALASALTRLKSVLMDNCANLVDLDLSNGTRLESLSMAGCGNLVALNLSNCTRLESLSTTGCGNLADLNLSNCTRLEYVSMDNCANLVDLDLSNGTRLESLSMAGCGNLVDLNLSNCTRLESLSMRGCGNLVDLNLSNCTRLQSVALNHCRNLSEQTVVQSLSTLVQLTELDLPYCNLTAEGLRSLSGLVMLQSLNLFENPLFTDAAIRFVSDLSLLKTLCLGRELDDSDELTVLDVSRLPHLEDLSLHYFPNLTDLDLSACTQLQSLYLEGCGLITDHALLSLSAATPLRDLEVSFGGDGITGAGLSEFTHLQRLVILDCHSIRDWSFLSPLTQIRELAVGYCDGFTSTSVDMLPTLTHIRNLAVTGCQGLTVLDLSGLSHLTTVDVTECENLDGFRLSDGVKITSFCLEGCTNISNAVVQALSVLVELETLDLNGCQNITDETVRYLASALPRLETLTLTDCPRITNHGVRSLSIGRGQGTGESRRMFRGRWI